MTNYGSAIREGFSYLLNNYKEVFTIGQGLWSPWYVGNTMTDLDKEFGKDRVIDTPVSELATTGAALGAALCGKRPIVIHPRVDFGLLAVDQIVNQAAKWAHMFGGDIPLPLVVRMIVNRGGEQGAQHSQSLHSWFAHIPGLRVVIPSTPTDARDLLIAASLGNNPVVYMDDRWLYDLEEDLPPIQVNSLDDECPKIVKPGSDLTIVGCGFTTRLSINAADQLSKLGIESEIIDLRVINPLKCETIIESVSKTGRLVVVDGDWENCGIAGEVIAQVTTKIELGKLKANPARITLPSAPAPTSKVLEEIYYISDKAIVDRVIDMMK
ncbi:Transketolase, C-terminal domain protein [Verrucomicrobiia bacterium DG1235]|nr:Transketolase, C-terminal domain protein [Verrucomicrobiae bacterium DG1235]